MNSIPSWLPDLVLFEDYNGIWDDYCNVLYEYFRQDFIESTARFRYQNIRIKKIPTVKGKEATFWHLIQEGPVEADRLPDLRRCERIRWPRPIIEAYEFGKLRYWPTKRKNETRHVLALDDFSYIVVLAQRKGYVILWTAYCVERNHRRDKFRREWENYERNRHRQ